MHNRRFRAVILFAAAFVFTAGASAQEGHPLTGTWYGEYETRAGKRDLTVIMKWDGRAVTGSIDPGPDARPLQSAVMTITPGKPAPEGQDSTMGTPPLFHLRFEVELPAAAGAAGGRTVFEGTIRNPVAGNRQIIGTWTRGSEKGSFRLRRL